ncbi:asparaginase domain-containing protein [Piscinibacterium candidicorallinum]|uniref:Asparaginase domain-containing protein n=1 Tax=Piscinibacterium candidicorallinum TaxID=1793872 RepID=A0ABV7H901_9BURK
MSAPSLHLIATGGTFDKTYDPIAGQLGFARSHLHEIVERCRINGAVSIDALPLMDSLDMQDADRQRVLASVQTTAATRIVIIHGTDTMPETARVLGPALKGSGKTVVITGAMVPYSIRGSDALFNLGFAAAVATTAAPGVYVAMNAQVFGWETVRKNRSAGRFEG